MRRLLSPVAAAAVAAVAVAGCGGGSKAEPAGPGPPDARATADVAAQPPAPSIVTRSTPNTQTSPASPARLDPVPAAGSASVEPGPFTDQLDISKLRLVPSRRPEVRASLLQATDVSEVLSLILRASFYDARGRLLGSATRDLGETEEFFDAALDVRLVAADRLPGAASATLGILSYVPE